MFLTKKKYFFICVFGITKTFFDFCGSTKKTKMKKLFYDLETTGLHPCQNGIHQISGCIEIDGDVKEWFNFKVKPFDSDLIDDKALETSRVTKEQIMEYESANQVYIKFLGVLNKYVDKFNKKDKFFLIGYNNSKFDDQFLRSWFGKLNDKYFGSWFWPNTVDVMSLASNYLMSVRENMENFKLMTVSKQLGFSVDETKLHDALYDIELTRNIYIKIVDNNPSKKTSNILDKLMQVYELNHLENQTQKIPREETVEEFELLSNYVLNDNLQALYDYYDLKDKLDKQWIDREMYHQKFPW